MKNILSADEFLMFCDIYKNPSVRGLRYNSLKKTFVGTDIPWCASGKIYDSTERPAKTIEYNAGLFYIQEPSAMCPAEVLGVKTGDKVLDICAAPGGKSVQIAGYLQGEGLLISNDASATRCRALAKNLERAGVTNAVILTEMPHKLAARFPSFFDKILVDAPCSGEGMFRRDKDSIKAYTANKPEACAAVQKEILKHAASMLKSGGRIVYSTCTFNTTENEDVITSFLENNKEFSIVQIEHEKLGIQKGIGINEVARIFPHLAQGEGHFIALMERKNSCNNLRNEIIHHNKTKSTIDFSEFLNISFTEKNLLTIGTKLYAQNIPIDLKGLRVTRSGWFLGEIKKERFVPSQALAMGIKKEQARFSVNLSAQDAEKYLKGESLFYDMPEKNKPWVLVCYENFPLGWARLVQGRLKNHMPTGWLT